MYGTEEAIQTHEGQVARQAGAPQKETILGAYEKGWMSVDGSVKGTKDAAEAQAQFKTGLCLGCPPSRGERRNSLDALEREVGSPFLCRCLTFFDQSV